MKCVIQQSYFIIFYITISQWRHRRCHFTLCQLIPWSQYLGYVEYLIYFFSGASIPIPSERSLGTLKNRGNNFFP